MAIKFFLKRIWKSVHPEKSISATVSNVINMIIAIGTVLAVIISNRSLKISNDALELTRAEMKSNDSINRIQLYQLTKSTNASIELVKANFENLELNKVSTNLQITESRKIREQFNQENMPYIFFARNQNSILFDFDSLKAPSVAIELEQLGKTTISIDSIQCGIELYNLDGKFRNNLFDLDNLYRTIYIHTSNYPKYVNINRNEFFTPSLDSKLAPKEYNLLLDNKLGICVLSWFYYYNFVSKKTRCLTLYLMIHDIEIDSIGYDCSVTVMKQFNEDVYWQGNPLINYYNKEKLNNKGDPKQFDIKKVVKPEKIDKNGPTIIDPRDENSQGPTIIDESEKPKRITNASKKIR